MPKTVFSGTTMRAGGQRRRIAACVSGSAKAGE
jgi:hypothetical protein